MVICGGLAAVGVAIAGITYWYYRHYYKPLSDEWDTIVEKLKNVGVDLVGYKLYPSWDVYCSGDHYAYVKDAIYRLNVIYMQQDRMFDKMLAGAFLAACPLTLSAVAFCSWLFPRHKEKIKKFIHIYKKIEYVKGLRET
jgi:hypothetical protein